MKFFIVLTVVVMSLQAFSQNRSLFDLSRDAGYEALAHSDYDRALKFLVEAQQSDVLQQPKEVNLKMLIDEIVRLVQKRKELGSINPSVRHKVMLLYVERVDGTFVNDKGVESTINQTLSDEDKKIARIRQGVMRELYEALSDGNFTIDFDEGVVTEPLKAIKLAYEKPWPDWNNYDGAAKIINENFDTHDTFIWCTTLIQEEAHGGFGRFPLGQGRLTPQKGFIELNPRFSPNMWMHEFFHVVEGMMDITPSHGHHKVNKAKFPGWPGDADNELDYYAWQFKTTVPAKGYDKLKIKSKLADETPGDPIENLEAYKSIGTWSPNQLTIDWSVLEWKVEDQKISKGAVKIMMLYTHGWKALDIAWVSIWQNGKQVAIDEHFGFSGTRKDKIVYTLELPENLKGSIVIKAKVKGDKGTDSNGKVLMKKD